MLRKTIIMVFALLWALTFPQAAPSQESAQASPEKTPAELRAERREQRQRNNPFPNGPPPGMIRVMTQAGIGSMQRGFGNTLLMMDRNPEMQKALGFSGEQVKEFEALRNELQGQMMQKLPQYAVKMAKMTPAEQAAMQSEMEQDFRAISERVNSIATPEQRQNARKMMFQATGGLDSPLLTPDALRTLNLSREQREKTNATFKEMEGERKAQLEELIGLLEKRAAGGGKMTDEDRAKFQADMEALVTRAAATGKKLGDALRKHLSDDQLALAKKLMDDRPGFLPKLPPQMRAEAVAEYRPGENSWKPGQGAPKNQEERIRKPFPLSELVE